MKKNYLKYMALGCMAVASLSFQSCSDDKSYDVVGNPDNLFYIKAVSSSSVSSPNTLAFAVVHTPVGDFGSVRAQYPIRCLRPADAVTTIKASLDNSLIDAYNTKYGTSYKQFPDGLLNVDSLHVTMQKDSVKGSDSLTISVPSTGLSKLTEEGYIAPLRITSVEGGNGKGSEDYGTAFLVVTTSTKLIHAGVGSSGMLGKLIENHDGWTATCDKASDFDINSIFDGDTGWGSGIDFDGNPATFVFDMQSVHNVTGIRSFCPYGQYASWGYYYKSITLSLSEDGKTWVDAGVASNSDMKNEKGYQYVCLYGAVKARYMKIVYDCNSNWGEGLYEFGVYAN